MFKHFYGMTMNPFDKGIKEKDAYLQMTAEAGKLWEKWLIDQYKILGIYLDHSVRVFDEINNVSGEIDILHMNPETNEMEITECKQYNGSNFYAQSEICGSSSKTPKPKDESLASLASHHATMCIFLGVGMIDKVVSELSKNYPINTPVAVVKKATWPDQEIVKGTLKDIAIKVKQANITKTAMIIVGEVLNPIDFNDSKLYDATFAHEYRDSKK